MLQKKSLKSVVWLGWAVSLLLLGGCATYRVGSQVPAELRTLAVPVFENASGFPEIDALTTQYVLRELQQEGTFKIAALDSASLKLLGRVVSLDTKELSLDRNYRARGSEYRYTLGVEITLVERSSGKLLLDALPLRAHTTFLTHGDMLTGLQDAGPRIAHELARKVVETLLSHWETATR